MGAGGPDSSEIDGLAAGKPVARRRDTLFGKRRAELMKARGCECSRSQPTRDAKTGFPKLRMSRTNSLFQYQDGNPVAALHQSQMTGGNNAIQRNNRCLHAALRLATLGQINASSGRKTMSVRPVKFAVLTAVALVALT